MEENYQPLNIGGENYFGDAVELAPELRDRGIAEFGENPDRLQVLGIPGSPRRGDIYVSFLQSAEEIHREDMRHWDYRWRYMLGWLPNQLQILWLRVKIHAQ